MLAGEGLLEAVDGVDMAIAKAARGECRKFLKAGPERVFLLNEETKRFGPMDSEDNPGAGAGIAQVAEAAFLAIGLVGEGERVGPGLEIVKSRSGIELGLFGDTHKRCAGGLCFEGTGGFAINKEHVIGKATLDIGFAQGHTRASVEVEVAPVLDHPASGSQL
jgi:hypothetical protein